jgi:hypothetical protein
MKGIPNRQKRIVTPRGNRRKPGLPVKDVQKAPARRRKVPKRTGRTMPPSGWIVVALGIIAWSCASSGPGTAVPLEARVKQLESSAPGVGEVMSGVQLHFGKLYYAARAANWGLAGFEIDEVKENLEKGAMMRPEENGVHLAGVVDAFEQTQIEAMKSAVAQRDTASLFGAYSDAILVCNSCHRNTGRPFIIITVPSAPPVSNQQWAPPGKN